MTKQMAILILLVGEGFIHVLLLEILHGQFGLFGPFLGTLLPGWWLNGRFVVDVPVGFVARNVVAIHQWLHSKWHEWGGIKVNDFLGLLPIIVWVGRRFVFLVHGYQDTTTAGFARE